MSGSRSAEYDLLVLSPHLDDAVLSIGGSLHQWVQEGLRVLVATQFAGDAPPKVSPFALELHGLWGFKSPTEVMPARRREDLAALGFLGVSARHGDLQDAVYRRSADGGWSHPDLAALRRSETDDPMFRPLLEQLDALPMADRVLAPLGAGAHIDHQLVHRAAQRLFAGRLCFYEDFPYAERLKARLLAVAGRRFSKQRNRLSDAAVEVKIEACSFYGSQLIGDLADGGLAQAQRRFVEARGGEVLWRPRREQESRS